MALAASSIRSLLARRDGAVVFALVAVAALPRLIGLAQLPLDPIEASQSIAAWTVAAPSAAPAVPFDRLDPRPESALLVGLQTLAFWIAGGASDGVARGVTALAGTVLVALPFALRAGAVTSMLPLTLLLAVDPWLIAASRRASGAVLAAAAALACHLLLRRSLAAASGGAVEAAARRHWVGWAVAAGTLVCAGASAWDFLPAVLGLAAIAALRRSDLPLVSAPPLAAMVSAGAATALLSATAGLIEWRAPALVSVSLESWLGSWAAGVGQAGDALVSTGALPGAVAVAVAYRVVLIGLAAIGLVLAFRRSSPADASSSSRFEAVVLAAWVLWGGLLQLRAGSAETAVALQVPLILAAALALERWPFAAPESRRSAAVRRLAAVAATVLAVAAALAGVAEWRSESEERTTLPPVRRLAADVAVLRERPLEERPVVVVESSPRIDAVLAWYLRDAAPRWVAAAEAGGEGTAPRLALRRRVAPANSAAPPLEAATYAVARGPLGLELIEVR